MEKFAKVLRSNWFGLVMGLILTTAAMLQEHYLGDMTNAWLLGLSISIIVGAFVEVVCFVMKISTFNWKKLINYIIGSLVGIIIISVLV